MGSYLEEWATVDGALLPLATAFLFSFPKGFLSIAPLRHCARLFCHYFPLLDSPAWKRLDQQDRHVILERIGLRTEPELKIGTDAELLRTLDASPLPLWRERTNALPQTIAGALLEAERLLEPQAVHVTLPTASLKTVEEVEDYLRKARELLLKHIEAGNPVVV